MSAAVRTSGWIAVAALFVAEGALYATLGPSPDQWFLDYAGWLTLRGATPYLDFMDGQWPASHWLHAASTALFGNTIYAWRLFDFGVLLAGAAWAAAICSRLWGRTAGIWALVLYPTLYITNGSWIAGQRDLIGTNLVLPALWFWWTGLTERRLGRQVWTGLVIGLCSLIKPTFALVGVALALHSVASIAAGAVDVRTAVRHVALAGVFSVVGLALGAGVVLAQGASLVSFYELGFESVAARYGRDVRTAGDLALQALVMIASWWHWIFAGAAASLAFHLRRDGLEGVAANALWPALGLAAVASYFVQGQGLVYTLGPIWAAAVPVLCSGLAAATDTLRAPAASRTRRSVRVAALALLVLVIAGSVKKVASAYADSALFLSGRLSQREYLALHDVGDGIDLAEATALAAELERSVPEDGSVLVWGRANAISFLARRAQPTRFYNYDLLTRPYATGDLTDRWTRRFEQDLTETPPDFCVVNHAYVEKLPAPLPRAAAFLRDFLARDYVPVRGVGDSILYRRRDV